MPKNETLPLSEDQIRTEIKYVHLNEQGVMYSFDRSPAKSRTIYFDPHASELFVSVTTSGPSAHRDPTLAEMEIFLQIMNKAYPQNQMTVDLGKYIQSKAEHLLNVAKSMQQST